MDVRLKERSGSVLIIVLWSVFFLASMGVAINYYIRPHISTAGRLTRMVKTRHLAEAGVRRAILEIRYDINTSYDALNEPWASETDRLKSVALGDGGFTVEFIDEERKININKAPYSVLENVIADIGDVNSQDAADIASAIIDWRDEDDDPGEGGAEGGYYSVLKYDYPSKNGDFEILEELLLVKGMTREIFDTIKDSITVHGAGAVNINTASPEVLGALEMEGELVAKIMHFRYSSEGGTPGEDSVFEDVGNISARLNEEEAMTGPENSRILKLVGDGLLSVGSDNFGGTSEGYLEGAPGSVKVTFVFDRKKNVIRHWRQE